MSIHAAVSSIVARYGTFYTLRRETAAEGANAWSQGAKTVRYYSVNGRERHYKPSEVRGAITENDVLIVIDAATAERAPVKGDRIALGAPGATDAGYRWRHIVNVYTTRVGCNVASYRVQARE